MLKKLFGKSEPAYTPVKPQVTNSNVTKLTQPTQPTQSNPNPALSQNQNDKKTAPRKAELFKRIKPATVAHLIRGGMNLDNPKNLASCPDSASVLGLPEGHQLKPSASKITDITNVSTISYASVQLSLSDNTEYVLVDLRDRDFYDFYHIQGAIHFPGVNVYRGQFISEIENLRNKKNALIIVYHTDEFYGVNYATSFTEHGFENVFLISGGIKVFQQEAPDLVESKKAVSSDPKKVGQTNEKLKKTQYSEHQEEGHAMFKSKNDKESVIVFSGKMNNP